MATELAMAMRRLKAQEATARQVADLSRKLDLVMAHLGIVDAPAAAVETAPVEESPADAKAEAETVPADPDAKADAEAIPADAGNVKSKKK